MCTLATVDSDEAKEPATMQQVLNVSKDSSAFNVLLNKATKTIWTKSNQAFDLPLIITATFASRCCQLCYLKGRRTDRDRREEEKERRREEEKGEKEGERDRERERRRNRGKTMI